MTRRLHRLHWRPADAATLSTARGGSLVHYFQPVGELELHRGSEQAFQFVELTVDGLQRPVRRTTRTGAQIFTVSLGTEGAIAKRTLAISDTYRVLIQQQGHLLHLDISRPTKGLRVELAYGGCDIRHINIVDYIASSRQPGLTQLPRSEPTPSATLHSTGGFCPRPALRSCGYCSGRWLPRPPVAPSPTGADHHGRASGCRGVSPAVLGSSLGPCRADCAHAHCSAAHGAPPHQLSSCTPPIGLPTHGRIASGALPARRTVIASGNPHGIGADTGQDNAVTAASE